MTLTTKTICAAIAMMFIAAPESQAGRPFAGHTALGAQDLADVRGGFALPNGMSVDIGFRAITLIDGVPVLSTQIGFEDAGLQPATPLSDRISGRMASNDESAALLSAAQDVFSYKGDGITVQHLAGQLSGQIVLNSGSDRTIDTVTAIDVRIQGFEPHPVSSLSQFTSAVEATARPLTF